ncbi:hypothetical protein [Amycolatopsis alkalitolerans]|uniref:Uncharacterized protein n=1 Tax=Amycolatopsis alkalitolerans TaxID=2547244 RepID=A0A5C4MBS5_9PSEU|nr:hypothetical protein [Amycolatopsis alkalitolerans]TNC29572.1 hypothetical protein FG385_00975 [Amycolatopsis alkalitolerans]
MIGGTAGVAEASTPAHSEAARAEATQTTLLCSTVDALQSALYDLSTTTDPALVNIELAHVIALLQQYPPVLPPALASTYFWLVAKLQILRGMVAALPTPQLIQLVNNLARHLADALDEVPCAPAAGVS